MLPVLVNIGDLPIHTYGVLIAIGFLLCVWMAKREGERVGLPGDKIVDLGFWVLLVGMLGSRILFIMTRWSYFSQYPIEMFYVWQGGLVFYGGPLMCIPFGYWYCKRNKISFYKVLDLAGLAIPLAHAFGRLGCLSAGCCHGLPTNLPWGIHLHTELVEQHLRGISLHPTQIYESVGLFVIFFFLFARRKKKKFDGELIALYAIFYSILRSIVEIFRGDSIRGFVIDGILSTSQFISLFVIAAAIVFYVKRNAACKRA